MSDIIRKLERRKQTVSVAQHRYNQLRSRLPEVEIAIVEGGEDAIFYSSVFKREGNNSTEHFFIANGKDNVLGLRDIIHRSRDVSRGGGVIFFVDKDFDGMKGFESGVDIYMTPTYSIENILVCRKALRALLLAEFKLGDANSINDVDRVIELFDKLLLQHEVELLEVNELIHCVRLESLDGNNMTSGSINDQAKLFADLDSASLAVRKNATNHQLEKLISITGPVNIELFERHGNKFKSLTPATNWRGKFIFYLFKRFISILAEDKNGKNPKFFTDGKGKISIDPSCDSFIRILSSLCIVPMCLKVFISDIPKNKLTSVEQH